MASRKWVRNRILHLRRLQKRFMVVLISFDPLNRRDETPRPISIRPQSKTCSLAFCSKEDVIGPCRKRRHRELHHNSHRLSAGCQHFVRGKEAHRPLHVIQPSLCRKTSTTDADSSISFATFLGVKLQDTLLGAFCSITRVRTSPGNQPSQTAGREERERERCSPKIVAGRHHLGHHPAPTTTDADSSISCASFFGGEAPPSFQSRLAERDNRAELSATCRRKTSSDHVANVDHSMWPANFTHWRHWRRRHQHWRHWRRRHPWSIYTLACRHQGLQRDPYLLSNSGYLCSLMQNSSKIVLAVKWTHLDP